MEDDQDYEDLSFDFKNSENKLPKLKTKVTPKK